MVIQSDDGGLSCLKPALPKEELVLSYISRERSFKGKSYPKLCILPPIPIVEEEYRMHLKRERDPLDQNWPKKSFKEGAADDHLPSYYLIIDIFLTSLHLGRRTLFLRVECNARDYKMHT